MKQKFLEILIKTLFRIPNIAHIWTFQFRSCLAISWQVSGIFQVCLQHLELGELLLLRDELIWMLFPTFCFVRFCVKMRMTKMAGCQVEQWTWLFSRICFESIWQRFLLFEKTQKSQFFKISFFESSFFESSFF